MIIEAQELMVPPSTSQNEEIPKLKKSHFINPRNSNQSPPNPPSISQTLDPKIVKKLAKSINFKGRKIPNDAWKTWVDDLQSTHKIIWKKAGIFDAIKASTYIIKRDDELIINLANYWCIETNTFVFPWGECSITLEDVMILGGFSVLGESVINLTKCSNYEEIHANLVNCCLEIKRKNNYHLPFYEWMKYFKGKSGELQHVGLIVQWLSRYVFCVDQFDVDVNCFDFAIALSQGVRIALAPAVLASIYRDLSLLKRKVASYEDESKTVLWSPMQLVQIWAWERFPLFRPEPRSLILNEPRIARWHDVYKLKSSGVGLCLESCVGGFLWRPYAMNVENWEFPKFYSDEGMFMVLNDEVHEEWLSLARCLGVSELVGLDCVEQYLPHRVGLQFGFDQDLVGLVPRMNGDLSLAWSSYDKPVDGVKLYVPPRLHDGEVTERYSKMWTCISPPRDGALEEGPDKKRKRKKRESNPKTKKALMDEVVPLNMMAPRCDNEMVSRSTNLIDKIDSSVAVGEGLFLKEPFQGVGTERSSSVLAEDVDRIDAVQTNYTDTESMNEFTKWCHDFS